MGVFRLIFFSLAINLAIISMFFASHVTAFSVAGFDLGAFAAGLAAIMAFAAGLVGVTLFATTKIIDLVSQGDPASLSKFAKYALSFVSTAAIIFSVAFLGGDKVFAVINLFFTDAGIGQAPTVPEGISSFQWVLTGFLDWLVAGGIWDWRSSKQK